MRKRRREVDPLIAEIMDKYNIENVLDLQSIMKDYNGRINSYKECLTLSKKIGYNLRKQYGGF
ncbi:hypothetical protein [Psychrilyobacter sp.]|uniref:hypothetical protein n=1 Tax=Psychrilyobacter sp. TaxID=2586924 RepID=UPI0030172FAF